jgi:hypothetical protein
VNFVSRSCDFFSRFSAENAKRVRRSNDGVATETPARLPERVNTMMHRDPSHSREKKKKRDAQTAFEELIARDPPPRRSRRVAAAEREKSQDDVGAEPRRKNEISVKKLGERDDERLASIARANPNASGTGTER